MKGILLLLLLALLPGLAMAEEGGSGHYFPGSMASFIDGVPPTETLITRVNLIYYKGSIDAGMPLPIGGQTALGVDAASWGFGLTLLWRPPLDLGDRWSYALSATIPYLLMDVSGDVNTTLPSGASASVHRSSSTNALGDIVLMPLMFNYNAHPDFNLNFRMGIYAPTGDYEVGRLANTGKNYWTFEPTVSLSYISSKIGLELTAFAGLDFNTENHDTDYQSGTQFHLDVTAAQHLPLFGGTIGVGANFFYYQQLEDDSGSGAKFFGDFKGRTIGIGPVLSYITKVWQHDLAAELKWLPEIDVGNRLKGDSIWFKLAMAF